MGSLLSLCASLVPNHNSQYVVVYKTVSISSRSEHLTGNVHETLMCRYTPVILRKVMCSLAGGLCGSLCMLRVLAPRRAFVGGRKQLTLWLAGGAYRTISLTAQVPHRTFVPSAFVSPASQVVKSRASCVRGRLLSRLAIVRCPNSFHSFSTAFGLIIAYQASSQWAKRSID